jgi:holliday junction DNA helicase RuvA
VIGKVSGVLDYRAADHVLIEAGGIGYLVYCSERTLAGMPAPGSPVALFTEMVVREDLMQLYGFPTLAEREWHRLLTTVQGVGAKAALAILGVLGPEGVARAIALGDAAAIRRAPGVGAKIAERVALELKNKAPAVMAMGAAGARPARGAATGSGGPEPRPERAPAAAPEVPVAVSAPAPTTERGPRRRRTRSRRWSISAMPTARRPARWPRPRARRRRRARPG